ncbi:MAG: phosphoribosylanthranilate isomerase [Pseudomonadota bacterium]
MSRSDDRHQRTRVKICGLTTLDDAQVAVRCGADALGFVFYDQSPRYVTPEAAQSIMSQLPMFVQHVGLFVNASADAVQSIVDQTAISLLQFHGDETPDYCDQFNRPYIKAIRVKEDTDVVYEMSRFSNACGFLLDAYVADKFGGTGQSFNWSLIPSDVAPTIALAGGLTPSNIGHAIEKVRPYAVDVSGGVEQRKGLKSHQKIIDFMTHVRRVDTH